VGPAAEISGGHKWIDPLAAPPGTLIAVPVELTMVQAENRDGETVADLARHRSLLCELDVVIWRRPATEETRLGRDKS
jgi:hypothetical protein